ncbi:MAG: CHAT domain-containing protein, partial [Sphingopyxis sp.]
MTVRRPQLVSILGLLAFAAPGTALAQGIDPTLRDSFSVGDQGGSLCEVQATVRDGVVKGMFDRAWTIVCRDASQPVGTVRELRASSAEALARIEQARAGTVTCTADGACTLKGSNIAWQTRVETKGHVTYSVEGF